MSLLRAIDCVNHVHRSPHSAAFRHVKRFDIEREEFRSHPALTHSLKASAIGRWRRARKVVIIVGHGRGDIVVRVNHYGLAMNLLSFAPEMLVARLRG